MLRNVCDVHTHTIYSRHAYSTIEECVRASAAAGVELLGSADHFGNMLYENPSYLDFQYFINRYLWPRTWMGVTVLRSAEADITDLEGHLYGWDRYLNTSITYEQVAPFTLLERVARDSDYLIASVHGKHWTQGATRAQLTDLYIKTMERNPKVLILGHIGRSGLDFEIDPVVEAARDLHRLVEINEHSFAYPPGRTRCRAIAERCAELGCPVTLCTDAHIACDIGQMDHALGMLDEIGFPEELLATRTPDAFLQAVVAAGLPNPLDSERPQPEA